MTVRLIDTDPLGIERVAEALGRGEVVGVPTDTVYGLAADPFCRDAVERIFALKGRPQEVALPVLVGSWDQIGAVAGRLPVSARRLARRFWPGALTLVVSRDAGFDADLGGTDRSTVGVRWPDHPVIQALCARSGPIAVTSANLHGDRPAVTAAEVADAFPGLGAGGGDGPCGGLVLDGGTGVGTPSTVVACRGPASRCLRDGAIAWSTIVGAG